MALTRHAIFADLPGAFTNTFGDPVSFTLASGDQVLQAIIREEADEFNDSGGGSGTVGDVAYLKLASTDAILIAEGDTLVHQSIIFNIEFPARDDGRGMTRFDLRRKV